MEIMKRTKKEEKAYDRAKNLENLKRMWTLLKAKLLNKDISADDTRTIQAHRDSQGILRDYYISNPYLQDGANYKCVNAIIEDQENSRFVYKGMLLGADNAIGVIESNVPLSEIIASPDGNIKLQEMLSEENATKVRDQYYIMIGEEQTPLKNHSTYFGKPEFVLGTILKGERGKFTFGSEISSDIEEMLQQEREDIKKEESMRDGDSVQIDIGGGMVVATQDCWLEQGNGIQFAGINKDALYYKYAPGQAIQTEDKKYVHIGELQIGKVNNVTQKQGEPIQFIRPFTYDNVVLWTDGKNLIQYFLDEKLNGLNFSLGDILTNNNIRRTIGDEEQIFVGGITKDESGQCKNIQDIPESVKKSVQDYMKQKQDKRNNIIKFNESK